jgi:hypothetical protein
LGRLLKAFAKNQLVSGAAVLALLLAVLFYPVVLGKKSLLLSAGTVASILPSGAYQPQAPDLPFAQSPTLPARSNDPGAAAWFAEPSYKLLHDEILGHRCVPLWNPYNGFGVPLLANMQSQPLFPLTALAWLFPGPWSVSMYLLARLFVAGFLMFLFLRLFVSHLPALAGGAAFMLTGYLILFLNMPELSVALTMPGVFWAIETAMRQPGHKKAAMIALGTALCLLGGMPETSMLILLLALVYALSRIIYGGSDRRIVMLQLRCYVLGSALGCMLAAPQMLPFIEYATQSFSTHQVGHGPMPGTISHGDIALHFLPYIAPLAFGPVGINSFPSRISYFGFNGYWGACVFFLASIAVVHWTYRTFAKLKERREPLYGATMFFAVAAMLLVMKKFGLPPIDWLGHLPLLNLIVYWKYAELPLSFALCFLCAAGMEFVSRRKVASSALIISFACVLALLLALSSLDRSALAMDPNIQKAFSVRTKLACEAICVSFALIIAAARIDALAWTKNAAFALVVIELSLFTVVPMFDRYHALPSVNLNPYVAAPFVGYLHSHTADFERVSGLDGVLFPNWSSAFNLFDVRDLDAMYPRRFLKFVRNFAYGNPAEIEFGGKNITTRFNGIEPAADFVFNDESRGRWTRFFELSSVRFILSTKGHLSAAPNPLLEQILSQNESCNSSFVRRILTFDGRSYCYGLFHHATAEAGTNEVRWTVTVPSNSPWLGFAVGVDPRKYDDPIGDGMTFKLSVQSAKVQPEAAFVKYINPVKNGGDRRFFNASIDLRKYAGKDVTLIFDVDAGPGRDNRNDWGEWCNMQWMPGASAWYPPPPATEFSKVYDREIEIVRLKRTLPRAAFYNHAVIAQDEDAALALLCSPQLSVWNTVVLERDDLPSPQMQGFSKTLPQLVLAEKITKYLPSLVQVKADTAFDGILVLNDTCFPGWHAYVDGKETRTVRANYLFRGIFVSAGKHVIEFRYEPLSFSAGCALAALALMVLFGGICIEGRKALCRAN